MAKMTIRATYALDKQTNDHIRQLARDWHVSQAEVIRRSVRQAAAMQKRNKPTPAEVIAHYRQNPLPRSVAASRRWADTNRRQRQADDVARSTRNEP